MNDRLSGKPGSFFSRVCAREEAREKVFRIWLRRTVKAGCLCKEVFGIFRLIPPASVCLNPPSRYIVLADDVKNRDVAVVSAVFQQSGDGRYRGRRSGHTERRPRRHKIPLHIDNQKCGFTTIHRFHPIR